MLREEKISENGIVTIDKVEESIRYLKAFEPHNGEGESKWNSITKSSS